MENIKRKLEVYEILFRKYGPVASSCNITEISLLLRVSERHVQTIIKRLVNGGWIEWKATPGRSKKAQLTCIKEPIEACYDCVSNAVDSGNTDFVLNILSFGGRNASIELKKYLYYSNKTIPRSVCMPFHRKIGSLLPYNAICRTERYLVTQVFQRLVSIENDRICPDFAHYWESDPSATRWRFYLRSGVVCHDGTPLTAQDAVRCLNKLITNSYWCSLYSNFIDVTFISEECIEIILLEGDFHLPRLLARSEASIYPIHLLADKIVGSGAFLVEVLSPRMIRLGRFEHYALALPLLERVDLWVYEEWAKDKVCAQNQLSLLFPEKTVTYSSQYHSLFMIIKKQGSNLECSNLVTYENNNECKKLAYRFFPSQILQEVFYGDYHRVDAVLCSILEESDRLYSLLAFFSLYPFKDYIVKDLDYGLFLNKVSEIKNTSDVVQAVEALAQLCNWLQQIDVIEIVKKESFELIISENLKGIKVNGFGWCDLAKLWIVNY
ncbi:ABC transporter substrate-binding protein [Aliivibrio fischeri]|uniref:ABC transporter substrate-binding protein n=1 Tax=Aliivibrio fischeri TaxID=668 RepID=A0A6N3YTD8_ALIFS|nr:SgrR family transcriptional regulator [Aliivibrio fischeri]MUK44532.1 ABC transporter substrate-binding protein [Aliivibrio fischeri]MUK79885.1 ABC transporter substrate-binding protein [Aliivibrio fischeri]MUK85603.1 ABC transporter substrate-binding protein [Aliivibrio fischeri]